MVIKCSKGLNIQINFEINRVYTFFKKYLEKKVSKIHKSGAG